jgi:hypothetical protein
MYFIYLSISLYIVTRKQRLYQFYTGLMGRRKDAGKNVTAEILLWQTGHPTMKGGYPNRLLNLESNLKKSDPPFFLQDLLFFPSSSLPSFCFLSFMLQLGPEL